MPRCIVLIGIPTAGKDYYIQENKLSEQYRILSCDVFRQFIFKEGNKYKPTREKEERVWKYFYSTLERSVLLEKDLVINNTNCKLKYVREITKRLNKDYKIEYIWFEMPLWKAYYRNVKRWIQTGKFIPFFVLDSMFKNYKNLKDNNEQYLVH